MSRAFNLKKDEWDLDFNNPGKLAIVRWQDMSDSALHNLTDKDKKTVDEPRDGRGMLMEIEKRLSDQGTPELIQRFLRQIRHLPQALGRLSSSLKDALSPDDIDINVLWGLMALNIELSITQPSDKIKLNRTADWMEKLRRALIRLYRAYRLSGEDEQDDKQEATLALIDVLEHTLAIMVEPARYLRQHTRHDDYAAWSAVQDKIRYHQKELDDTIKHLSEINNYSQVGQKLQVHNLQWRHMLGTDDDEGVRFPIKRIPWEENPIFYGREAELKEMDKWLSWNRQTPLRTFQIYGRRGIGKTSVALEYAKRNPSRFDAIFWIACETSLTLRTSITEMAIALNLKDAESKRNHEENLLNVQNWLKKTNRTWLMIFDNADKDSELTLRSYLPTHANGSILITSRDYYNFMKDKGRKGETVSSLTDLESWELLQKLMGGNWNANNLSKDDIDAAKLWIKDLGGLPLSIVTASSLLRNPKPETGLNISETYSIFQKRREDLPRRQLGDRPKLIRTLDALFDMNFKALSTPARKLLSVLALLSPDEIPIELFLPRNQAALDGILAFAKQESPIYVNEKSTQATLSSIVNLSAAFAEALEELKSNKLIRWDHRVLAVHRVTAEAMNWNSKDDLQESFNSAVQLVYEAFPKQNQGNTLYDEWKVCEIYITHAVHLAKKYHEYQNPDVVGSLTPAPQLVELLHNATWYLFEMSDYDLGNEILDVAKGACPDKESHLFSLLCNTHGCNFIELNKMKDTRRNYQMALSILEKLNDDIYQGDLADVISNMGNLESATGHFDEALDHYYRAAKIYPKIGDSAAWKLANTYMGIGRCYASIGNATEARKHYGRAEQLYTRTKGQDQHFMAYCYYAYGNLEMDEKLNQMATRSFEACLKIASKELPIHPITAAAFYSLGCTEAELENYERAKGYLRKARNIAELRSPTRDDGTIARILWKTAMVIRASPSGTGVDEFKESEALLSRAYDARATLIAAGEGVEVKIDVLDVDNVDGKVSKEQEEESFDLLVPGIFR